MRNVVIVFALLGLTAAPAFAGIARLTHIPGTFAAPSEFDAGNGLTFAVIGIESLEPPEDIPYTLGSEVYDNWPTIFGGAGWGGHLGFFLGTWGFFRWGDQPSQWGDDTHGITGDQLNHVHYGFLDIAGGTQPHTSMHTIQDL